MTITKLALLAHHDRGEATAHAKEAAAWCDERGVEFWMPHHDAAEVGLTEHASDRPTAEADIVVSLGGDGTMLRSVSSLHGADVPLLGVNLGLGPLAANSPLTFHSKVRR